MVDPSVLWSCDPVVSAVLGWCRVVKVAVNSTIFYYSSYLWVAWNWLVKSCWKFDSSGCLFVAKIECSRVAIITFHPYSWIVYFCGIWWNNNIGELIWARQRNCFVVKPSHVHLFVQRKKCHWLLNFGLLYRFKNFTLKSLSLCVSSPEFAVLHSSFPLLAWHVIEFSTHDRQRNVTEMRKNAWYQRTVLLCFKGILVEGNYLLPSLHAAADVRYRWLVS